MEKEKVPKTNTQYLVDNLSNFMFLSSREKGVLSQKGNSITNSYSPKELIFRALLVSRLARKVGKNLM